MSARPFQLGDRVRITHGDEVHEGIADDIHPIQGHPDVMWLTIKTDEPYAQDDGNVVQNDSVTLTLDCTAVRHPLSTSIELLEAAVDVDQDADVVVDEQPADEPGGNAVYECTECQYVSVCGAGASDEDYADWQRDGYEHDEWHRERDDDTRAEPADVRSAVIDTPGVIPDDAPTVATWQQLRPWAAVALVDLVTASGPASHLPGAVTALCLTHSPAEVAAVLRAVAAVLAPEVTA